MGLRLLFWGMELCLSIAHSVGSTPSDASPTGKKSGLFSFLCWWSCQFWHCAVRTVCARGHTTHLVACTAELLFVLWLQSSGRAVVTCLFCCVLPPQAPSFSSHNNVLIPECVSYITVAISSKMLCNITSTWICFEKICYVCLKKKVSCVLLICGTSWRIIHEKIIFWITSIIFLLNKCVSFVSIKKSVYGDKKIVPSSDEELCVLHNVAESWHAFLRCRLDTLQHVVHKLWLAWDVRKTWAHSCVILHITV